VLTNPFTYGGVVGYGEFCNRTQELADLNETMRSCGRCFVYAERRMGKTSLVMRALDKLPKKSFIPVYVDLWPTDGSASFATTTARAITSAAETRTTKLLEFGKAMFGRLRPSVSLDDAGQPKVDFGIDGRNVSKTDLTEVLAAPQALAERSEKTVVVVFDEFQQIADYEDDLTERQIRSSIQHHKNVGHAYVTLWESLTKNEQRFLRGLADRETPPQPFSSDFTRQYGLRSASNAQRAADSLVAKDLIEREASSYVINDRFLRLWISQLYS
jgi:hypothetical protein